MEQSPAETEDDGLLGGEELRHISRHINDIVPSIAPPSEGINDLRTTLAIICQTAASPSLNTSHRVAAWNTLCAIIDRCCTSAVPSLRDVVYAKNVHLQAFDIYLSQSHSARPKASKQLLGTVSTALSILSRDKSSSKDNEAIVAIIINHLVNGDDNAKAKASALALAHFLSKRAFDLALTLETFSRAAAPSRSYSDPALVEEFLFILFRWLGRSDFGSTIGHLVSVVLDKHGEYTSRRDMVHARPVWLEALKKAHRSVASDVPDLRVHILPLLFKRSAGDFRLFLNTLGLETLVDEQSSSDQDQELLYASLQTGKELSLLMETDQNWIAQKDGCILFPNRGIEGLLSKSSRNARVTGLSLLISSHTATRPIVAKSLRLLHLHLDHSFADTDANFRGEVFSLVQRLIDRIRAITAVLARQVNKRGVTSGEAASSLELHRGFISRLLGLIRWGLRPTASYQRHISALKCLKIVLKSGVDDRVSTDVLSKSALGEAKWPFSIPAVTDETQELLLDLLTDPFDDVRQTAAAVLLSIPSSSSLGEYTTTALKSAETIMLATGRADQADGVAHMYAVLHRQATHRTCSADHTAHKVVPHLVHTLETMLRIAHKDISKAVEKYPLHGLITSLRYVLVQSPRELTEDVYCRLVACLQSIWDVVKPILCNDAPEGYLPEDLEAVPEISTKDTLSYCWRALKEGSLLLGILVSTSMPAMSENSAKFQRLTLLSELCFTQLAELRHRGAFSTVAQTWNICCVRCQDLETTPGMSWLRVWYNQVMIILRNKTTINTRRSAGLPSLLCGLLIADRSGKLMRETFVDMEHVAREEVGASSTKEGSLPQVHAMNCLKDVLKNSKLGEQTEQYVASSLQLAADALRSESWAIRNCGLMLFRAVIDRLFGTSEAVLEDDGERRSNLSTEQNPQLFKIVLDLISGDTGEYHLTTSRYEGVFPALQLLQRMHIPPTQRQDVERAIHALMGSPVWHVRDKAARTYAALPIEGEIWQKVHFLLCTSTGSQNTLHGALLCAKYTLKNSVKQEPDANNSRGDSSYVSLVSRCLLEILDAAPRLYSENHCLITRRAYLDLYSECMRTVQDCDALSDESAVNARSEATQIPNVSLLPLLELFSQSLDTVRGASPTGRLLRPALARACALQLPSQRRSAANELTVALVEKLARFDTDACIAFMEVAREQWRSQPALSEVLATMVEACGNLLHADGLDTRLRSEVLRTLLTLIPNMESRNLAPTSIIAVISADRNDDDETNQTCANLSLELQAVCIECCVRSNEHENKALFGHLGRLVGTCERAIVGSGLHTPEAAASSINHIRQTWQIMTDEPMDSRLLLRLCIVVYDLLNDDDEDMRAIGSQCTGRILAGDPSGRSSPDSLPLVASRRLTSFMTRRWHDDAYLARLALERAFGISQQGPVAVSERLKQYAQSDNALFAEEKQNLYIDEAREVKVWSAVLRRLDSDVVSRSARQSLSHWTVGGLRTLIERLTLRNDGELGWTSDANVFVLGLQVIYGAELLLDQAEQGKMISVQPSHLRRSLTEFSAVNGANHGNCLWQIEVERVLSTSVLHKLGAVQTLLHQIGNEVNAK